MSVSARPPAARIVIGKENLAPPLWAAKRGDENARGGRLPNPFLPLGGGNWEGAPAPGKNGSGAGGGGSFKLPQRPQSAVALSRSASDGSFPEAPKPSNGSKALRTLNIDPQAPVLQRDGQQALKATQPTSCALHVPAKEHGAPMQSPRAVYCSPRGRIKCRPLSAMANLSRGLASCAEREQIEGLKREILEITRSMPAEGREGACRETEEALTRFVYTKDAGQSVLAKCALLAMVLQKQEEFGRHALLQTCGEAEAGSVQGARRLGEGRGEGSQQEGRFGVMQRLLERARALRESLDDKTRQHDDALLEAQAARQENKKLREECDLMRAALTQGAGRKIGRPFSAPRQRSVIASEPSVSSASCEACEGSEGRARAAEAEAKALQAKADEMQALVDDLQKRSGEDTRMLRERVADLERLLSVKSTTITSLEKSLKLSAAELKKALGDLSALRAADKSAAAADRIKELESQLVDSVKDREEAAAKHTSAQFKAAELEKKLAGASIKIASMEKRLAECQERLKALGSANRNEEELLAKHTALAKSLGEATDEVLKLRETLEKEREEAERLRTLLRERKDEADACSNRLIKQVRDLMAKLKERDGELRGQAVELRALREAEGRLKERNQEMEEAVRGLKASQGDASMRDRQIEELMHKLGVLGKELMKSNKDLEDLRKQYDGLKFSRDRDQGEMEVLRAKIYELRASLEKARANAGNEPELVALREKLSVAMRQHDTIEKKLHGVMRRAEASEQRMLEIERERDETRAIETAFKGRMKAMYDKRVKELEQVRKELEAQRPVQEHADRASDSPWLGSSAGLTEGHDSQTSVFSSSSHSRPSAAAFGLWRR